MAEGTTTLAYAVRLSVLAKYLGQLFLMLAALTLVPLGAALIFQDYESSMRYLLIVILLTLCSLSTLNLPTPRSIQINEALTITALAFLLTPALMTYPIMAADLPLLDAFFEAVSALTTTGLTTLRTVEDKPKSFLFARAWIQLERAHLQS